MALIAKPVLRARRAFRDWLAAQPAIFEPIARRRQFHDRVVAGPDTDIVIEGYPRSGNTYGAFAFVVAQGGVANVASHFHTPAQFALAARYRRPAVLVIRKPLEVVVSNLRFFPWMTPNFALRTYISFHKRCLKNLDRLVVSDFPETTGRFGHVIERVNRKFGTAFAIYQGTPDDEKKTRNLVEHSRDVWVSADKLDGSPDKVALPTPEKAANRAEFERQFVRDADPVLLKKAEDIYALILARANG